MVTKFGICKYCNRTINRVLLLYAVNIWILKAKFRLQWFGKNGRCIAVNERGEVEAAQSVANYLWPPLEKAPQQFSIRLFPKLVPYSTAARLGGQRYPNFPLSTRTHRSRIARRYVSSMINNSKNQHSTTSTSTSTSTSS